MANTDHYEIPAYSVPSKSEQAQFNFQALYNPNLKKFYWSNNNRTFGQVPSGALFVVINENEDVRKILLCRKGCDGLTIQYHADSNTTIFEGIPVKGDYTEHGFFESDVLETASIPEDFALRRDLQATMGSVLLDLHDDKHRTKLNYLRSIVPYESEMFTFFSRGVTESGVIPLHEEMSHLSGEVNRYINSFLYYRTENGKRHYLKQIIPRSSNIKRNHAYYRDFVYFIYLVHSNCYKIGRAQDPYERKASFAPGNPQASQTVLLLLTMVDGRLESSFHQQFRKLWIPTLAITDSREHFRGAEFNGSDVKDPIHDYIKQQKIFQNSILAEYNRDKIQRPDSITIKVSYDSGHDEELTKFGLLQGTLF